MSMRSSSTWMIPENVPRPNIVSGVFLFATLNGISETVYRSIQVSGFWDAVAGTFGISIIVFACVVMALQNLSRDPDRSVTSRDLWFLLVPVCLVAIPHPSFSWLAITLLALYEYKHSVFGTPRRRGAALMFGLTIPMFWGKIVFALFSSWILKGDALLVSMVTHSANVGNVVSLPHQNGFLWVAPACSSFSNISLAMLCWLMFTEYAGRPRSAEDYVTCFFASVNVVMVNVARISLIAVRPDLYDQLHGPLGATIASWLTAITVLATCAYGVKREPVMGRSPHNRVPSRDSAAGPQSQSL